MKLKVGIALTTYFILILFAIAPLLSVLISIVLVALSGKTKYLSIIVLALLLSLYLGSINATKIPESDLLNFYSWLSLARSFTLTQYVVLFGKEPFYFLWIYLIGNFPGINGALFVLVSTAVVYFIFFFCLISLGRAINWTENRVMGVMLLFAFFAPLFNASAHLMREFMAGAFVLIYFVRCILGYKKNIWVLFLAALTHSTAAIFIPFAIISGIRNLPRWATYAFMVATYSAIYILAQTATTTLAQIPFIGYVFIRLIDTGRDVYVLGLMPMIFAVVIGFGSLFLTKIVRFKIIPSTQAISFSAIKEYSVSVFFLSVFILLMYLHGDTMYPIRFLLYLYFLSGVLLVFLQAVPMVRFATIAVSYSILPVYFFYNLSNGVWTYASLDHILFYPFILNF